MHVFLSYSASDRKLAEQLRDELGRAGLTISTFHPQERAGVDWRKQLEAQIGSCDDILILVGSNADEAQRLEWRAALEAVWKDSHKRLIPILVRNAALPPFVFGDAGGDETKVIRLLDPRDVRSATEAILAALQRGGHRPTLKTDPAPALRGRNKRSGGEDPALKITSYPVEGESSQQDDGSGASGSVEVGTKGGYSYEIEEARQDRIQELKKLAERLKD